MSKIAIRFELDTNCYCSSCANCGIGYMDERELCDECNNPVSQLEYGCGGECWQDSKECADYAIQEYLDAINNPQYLRIDGQAMGWRRLSGHKIIRANWEELFNALALDRADYRLQFTYEDDIFKVIRYSHDEPMGARFIVSATDEEDSEL